MDNATIARKRVGRPPEFCLPDMLVINLWYQNLATTLGVSSPTAIARKIIPNFFDTQSPDWHLHRSEREMFGKISRNEKPPPHWLIYRTERLYRGSSYWCLHPFRLIAKRAIQNPKELYAQLAILRPAISSILFFPRQHSQHPPRRKHLTNDSYKKLCQESDIDALTVCLGLALEADFFGDQEQYLPAARYAEEITLRLISDDPFLNWGPQLYAFLTDQFFHSPLDKPWSLRVKNTNVIKEIDTRRFVLHLIDELGLRHPKMTSSATSLYFAEQCLWKHDIEVLQTLCAEDRWKDILEIPGIMTLKNTLKQFEHDNLKNSGKIVLNLMSSPSRPVKANRHQRSPKISPGGQSHRNAQLRGLDQNDHDAGDD